MFHHSGQAPRWLDRLEKPLGWIGIPHIAIILVSLQGFGYFMMKSNPEWSEILALIPERVLAGEYWRLVTFLMLPVSLDLLWVIFALWFLYFVVNSIENQWGYFRTTFYVLVSIGLTIIFSLVFGFPVTDVTAFHTSLFLATATLFPEQEIQVYMIFPVKMKWLGWLSFIFIALRFLGASLLGKLYLLAIYSNYLIFFGPALVSRIKNEVRRRKYLRDSRPKGD